MSEIESNPALHFIVRSADYTQHLGYTAYLDKALTSLNNLCPTEARNLLTETAEFLRSKRVIRSQNETLIIVGDFIKKTLGYGYTISNLNNEVLRTESTPSLGNAALKATRYAVATANPESFNDMKLLAGPMSEDTFGLLAIYDTKYTPIVTPILQDGSPVRGYSDAVKRNCTNGKIIPHNIHKTFTYTHPTKKHTINLMQIGSVETLSTQFIEHMRDYSERMKTNPDIQKALKNEGIDPSNFLDPQMILSTLREHYDSFIFLHPNCTKEFFNDIVECIDPLLKIIDKKQASKNKDNNPPQEKIEAMAEIYWLLAQSTPVVRGGSAYANVIMQHLAHRLNEQGYNYNMPHKKAGVDLWAEAVTLPVDEFKKRFIGGVFFDDKATDQTVMREHLEGFNKLVGKAIKEAMTSQASAVNNITDRTQQNRR